MDVNCFQRDGHYWIRAEGPDGKPGEFEVKYTPNSAIDYPINGSEASSGLAIR